MKTYEDLLEVGESEDARQSFVRAAINDYKSGQLYREARDAYQYYAKRNVTISEYQKLLYTLSGKAVPDNYSANFKLTNAFFRTFVMQENSHLLGNGITFNDPKTKERLGGDKFDDSLMDAGEFALWGGVSYGFYNQDHVDVFKATEFVPLVGEEDGGLHAGIRFWQINEQKPMRATLYEEDGYTEYIWNRRDSKEIGEVLREKKPYIEIVQVSVADGEQIIDGKNYPGFPIVPLWGNNEHQSELVGLREKIDAYDLIQSGFANDLEDAAQIYWIVKNAGGMDDVDFAQFLERLHTVKGANVDDNIEVDAHTVEIPYNARMTALANLRESLYNDAMALDTEKIVAGNIAATAIRASYEKLTEKCDAYEKCVRNFISGLLALIGIEDTFTFMRSKIVNMMEDTQVVMMAADHLDDETILRHLPFLSPDEVDGILDRKVKEEADRIEDENTPDEAPEETPEEIEVE